MYGWRTQVISQKVRRMARYHRFKIGEKEADHREYKMHQRKASQRFLCVLMQHYYCYKEYNLLRVTSVSYLACMLYDMGHGQYGQNTNAQCGGPLINLIPGRNDRLIDIDLKSIRRESASLISHTFTLDRCPIDIDPRVSANCYWGCNCFN